MRATLLLLSAALLLATPGAVALIDPPSVPDVGPEPTGCRPYCIDQIPGPDPQPCRPACVPDL